MKRWKFILVGTLVAMAIIGISTVALAAATSEDLQDICPGLFGSVFGVPNSEPLGVCQWDMALINASEGGSYAYATGVGVTVGVIDSGVDFSHPATNNSICSTPGSTISALIGRLAQKRSVTCEITAA